MVMMGVEGGGIVIEGVEQLEGTPAIKRSGSAEQQQLK
jgi:hypothetical protein